MRLARAQNLWGVMALLVVAATVTFARRELTRGGRPSLDVDPQTIEDTAHLADAGILLGDVSAPLKIVEFSDFECRYCRRLQPTLAALRERHPDDVAIVFRHFPMSRIGFALPAAIAAECAAAQDRFDPFAELLFESQDTLARLDLEAIAMRAGVPDTADFHACRIGPGARMRVSQDIEAGRRLGIRATPTMLVGDQLLVGERTLEELEAFVRLALKR